MFGLDEDYGLLSPIPGSFKRTSSVAALRGTNPLANPSTQADDQITKFQGQADQYQQQATDLMNQPPDVSGYQKYAKQRGEQGQQSLVMALAAQRAGQGFDPVQAQFLKQAVIAQQPIEAGKAGMVTPQGDFMADPTYGREQRIKLLTDTATKYDQLAQRATDAEMRRYAAEQSQLLRAQIAQDSQQVRVDIARGQQAIGQQNADTRAKLASGNMSPDTVDYLAERVISGDKTALQNVGRGAQSAQNLAMVQAAVTQKAHERNLDPAAIARAQANITAFTAGERTAANTAANLSQAGNEAKQQIDIVRQTGADLGTSLTKFPMINEATIFALRNSGDPRVSKHAAAIQSLVNTYTRAVSPKGVSTVSDKNHAYDILNKAMAMGQLNATLDLMNQEIDTAHSAVKSSRADRQENFFPGQGGGAGVPTQHEPDAGWSVVR